MSDKGLLLVKALFEKAGLRMIYMVRDDFFLLVPLDGKERERVGTAQLPTRAVEAMERVLSGG